MSYEPTHTKALTGDGHTTYWDFGVPVRQLVGVQDQDGHQWQGRKGRARYAERGVFIDPPLLEGEKVNVFYLSDHQ